MLMMQGTYLEKELSMGGKLLYMCVGVGSGLVGLMEEEPM